MMSILRRSPYLRNFVYLYIHKVYAQKKIQRGNSEIIVWISVLLHCQVLWGGSELWYFCFLK